MKTGDKIYDYSANEYTIDTVGRKYFTIKEDYGRTKIVIDTLKSKSDFRQTQYYIDKQSVLNIKETHDLTEKIRRYFYGYGKLNLTLDQLRQINNIINPL